MTIRSRLRDMRGSIFSPIAVLKQRGIPDSLPTNSPAGGKFTSWQRLLGCTSDIAWLPWRAAGELWHHLSLPPNCDSNAGNRGAGNYAHWPFFGIARPP